MPKKPPQDDEQAISDDSSSYRSSRRLRNTATSRRAERDYFDDEHPEVPSVRRASLYLDQTEQSTVPESSSPRSTRSRRRDEYDEMAHGSTQARQGLADDDAAWEGEEDDEIAHGRTQRGRSRKLEEEDTVQHRQAPRLTSPLPPAHPRVQTRYAQPRRGVFQGLHRNQTLLLVGIILGLMLIIIPIVAHTSQQHITLLRPKTASNGTAVVTAKDPHAIVITPSDADHPAPPVFASSAYLMDVHSGATLYAANPFEHLPMLSTTKLMTMLLVAEHGNLDQKVTISGTIEHDINGLSADSSLMGIKKGETYTMRDLLYGAMLVSGNDAATAMADTVGGSEQNFVNMMNQRAHALGMNDTHYMNPHGLLMPGHYSCAHDLAIIGRAAFSNSTLSQMSTTKSYHITANRQHADHYLINDDQFFWWYPGVDGG
ncbi:MAG TPA: serine hydrolase, partial [Ktedonobacteraceae bacterium]|nr:serine hydrolase [Ktedonobacteraceae bacterium]